MRGGGYLMKFLTIGGALLACAAWAPMARATTEAEKSAAIQKGLAYLHGTQQAAGNWNASGYEQAATGAATLAFLSQQDKWASDAARYQATVNRAITYLVSSAHVIDVTTRNDGVNICPSGSVSCKAIYWNDSADSAYTTGSVSPAIALYGIRAGANVVATTSGPLAGLTWGEIAQGITNGLAVSQNTKTNGNRDGGWHDFSGDGDADSSSTEAVVMALLYDEALGAVTPQATKNELKVWLGNIQSVSGGVCFQPGTEPCDHANTGGWLLAMRFVGHDLADWQLQAALAFLNAQWQATANNLWYGNFGHPYAMWSVFAGLEATVGLNDVTHIANPVTDCGASTNELPGNPAGSASCTWWEDYNEWLVKNQKVDGSWSGYSNWTDPISTAFYVSILGATQIPSLPQNPTPASTDKSSQAQSSPSPGARAPTTPIAALASAQATSTPAVSAKKVRPYERKGVTAVDVAPDTGDVAGASTDNNIHLFDPVSGQEIAVLQGSVGLPTSVAFGPNGSKRLNSAGRDSVARVWDTQSVSQVAMLAGHEQAVRAIAASSDGKFLASGGEDTRVLLWDQTNNTLSKVLFGPTNFVNALSFSPDGRLLAVGGEDARVLIFDVASGKLLFTLLGHSGAINAVAFSPDGTVLASGGQDTVIHLWDPVNGVQRQTLAGHQAPIRALAFNKKGDLLASGGEDAQIILWNTADGTINKALLGTTGFINSLAFGNPAFLASASDAGNIALWNVQTGNIQRVITVP